LAAPRVIGKSKRGARLKSPVLRTIGTRSRPLLGVQSTVFGAGSAAMGTVESAPRSSQASPVWDSENPFASLRVSIPSPVASINRSVSASGPMTVSTACSLAWPVQMQAPAYPAVPPRNFENHEFGRPSSTFAVSAPDSHPTYGQLVSPTDEILSGTGFVAPSSSAMSRSAVSLMPPPSVVGTAQMTLAFNLGVRAIMQLQGLLSTQMLTHTHTFLPHRLPNSLTLPCSNSNIFMRTPHTHPLKGLLIFVIGKHKLLI
jgi:hypothetical protein